MISFRKAQNTDESKRAGEQGWALLGLLLALGVMSIVLSSSIVPNVQMQVQRDKEAEMLYRGQQMAEGIARYYGRGFLRPLNKGVLLANPLTELEKLPEGLTIGVREFKFVRPSAMIDPMISAEWEPVRVRDPRLLPFLQAWGAQTLRDITVYLDLARPPQGSAFGSSKSSTPKVDPETGPPGQQPPIINPANPGNTRPKLPGQDPDPDPDDDDDDINDPFGHLFESGGPGKSNAPIVGVATKKKGKAANAYFGLENYEEWVFIYLPLTPLTPIPVRGGPQGGPQGLPLGVPPNRPPTSN